VSGAAWAIVLALFIGSGMPLGRWVCRTDPGPCHQRRSRAEADRALLRLAQGEGRCPHDCITCRVLAERTSETDR
jgi:hypothetical protein